VIFNCDRGGGFACAGMRLLSSAKTWQDRTWAFHVIPRLISLLDLIADGHLVSRERSGVFRSRPTLQRVSGFTQCKWSAPRGWTSSVNGQRRVCSIPASAKIGVQGFRLDWQSYRYPFLEAVTTFLVPIAEWPKPAPWRAPHRKWKTWSVDSGEADDDALIEEISHQCSCRAGASCPSDDC